MIRRLTIELLEYRNLLTTITLTPQQDTTLFEDNSGTLANGAGEYLFVGSTANRNNGLLRRGLISFDLTGQIPEGASINSVSLTLNMSRTITGDESVSLHQVLTSWREGTSDASGEEGRGTTPSTGDATWVHRQFPTDIWDSPGGDFMTSPSAIVDVGVNGSYTWTDPEMVLDVEHWLQNPDENFGWILLGNEDATTTAKRFDSRENSVNANRPSLTIDLPSTTPSLNNGDFDLDDRLTVADIDALSAAVRDSSPDPLFDLNNDGIANQEDRRIWVEDLFGTFFGDASLDKVV